MRFHKRNSIIFICSLTGATSTGAGTSQQLRQGELFYPGKSKTPERNAYSPHSSSEVLGGPEAEVPTGELVDITDILRSPVNGSPKSGLKMASFGAQTPSKVDAIRSTLITGQIGKSPVSKASSPKSVGGFCRLQIL